MPPNALFRKISSGANSFRRQSRFFSDKDATSYVAEENGRTTNGAVNGHRQQPSIPEEPAAAPAPAPATPPKPAPTTTPDAPPTSEAKTEEEVHGVPVPQSLKDLGKQVKQLDMRHLVLNTQLFQVQGGLGYLYSGKSKAQHISPSSLNRAGGCYRCNTPQGQLG